MGVFYQNGLRFTCARCGACCRGEPGYVFLSLEDIDKIAAFLGKEAHDIVNEYCVSVFIGPFRRLSLREKVGYDCIFWNDECTVYEARPIQCRLYPFWPSLLDTPNRWDDEAKNCPGIDKGRLHTSDEIVATLEKMEKNLLLDGGTLT